MEEPKQPESLCDQVRKLHEIMRTISFMPDRRLFLFDPEKVEAWAKIEEEPTARDYRQCWGAALELLKYGRKFDSTKFRQPLSPKFRQTLSTFGQTVLDVFCKLDDLTPKKFAPALIEKEFDFIDQMMEFAKDNG
jgi:hypothetical protein